MLITKNQILDAIAALPLNVQTEISRVLTEQIQYKARQQLRLGARVQFRSKHGALIEGTVHRINGKSVKVLAGKDRYGNETLGPVTWTVSPQLLTVL